jgi:hypothetical protein
MTLGDYITWLTFAAGAYALGVLAWRRFSLATLMQQWWRDYVATSVPSLDSSELSPGWRSDAVDRPQTDHRPTPTVAVELSSEPSEPTESTRQNDNDPQWIEVSREELIESLSLVLVLEADGSKRKLSQDIVSKAAGMGKETTAALMRQARHEPEPAKDAPKPNPADPQFVKVSEREQYQRINAKPLR